LYALCQSEKAAAMGHHVFPPSRLEAFSDGVIAVIITIMVLELKVPHQDGIEGLRVVLPTLGLYLISFAFVGIYWINHHQLVHRTQDADELVLYANLSWLFCLSLLPFFTAYVLDKKMNSFSVALYISSMIVTGFSFLLLRLSISRRLRHAGRFEAEDKAVERKNWLSLFVYVVAVPLAFQHPRLSLGLVALVTVIWITPTTGLKRPEEYPPRDRI
jgi:uncharacterized membrane protein